MRHVLVVGAGLAGARTCEQLRLQGHTGRITLIGAEPDPPYDRPPLSKAVLSGRRDDTTLAIDFAGLGVQTRFATAATGLHVREHVVETTSGPIEYDALVIATGARPVQLPGGGKQQILRSLRHALDLRASLRPGSDVVIVGASWIGAEVATSALARGCRVTCVEAAATVSHLALGGVGKLMEPWWHGVDLRLNTKVDRIEDRAVHLADGGTLAADVVIVGVGVRPDAEWVRGSALQISNGILVDERLRAGEDVVALGDVSAWWSRRYGQRLRVEHWDNAVSAAAVAAATVLEPLADQGPVYDPVPYFWSDQFGHKVQYLGWHGEQSRPVIRSAADSGLWNVVWLDEHEQVTAVLLVDRPRDLMAARRLIEMRARVPSYRIADGDLSLRELVSASAPTEAG
jgi:3-phenylpropionate/trans-cinnamate dioxygenase ferredoxin reductase component